MSLTLNRRPERERPLHGGAAVSPELVTSADVRRRTRASRREIMAVIEPVWATPGSGGADSLRAPVDVVQAAAERLTRFLEPGEMVAGTDDGLLTLRLRRGERSARPVRLQEMAYHAVEVLDAVADTHGLRRGVIDLGVGWSPITRKRTPRHAEADAASAAAESLLQRDLQPRHSGVRRRVRQPRINLWSAGWQVLWATAGAVVLPFLALVGMYSLGLDVSGPVYWALIGALSITALTIWAECSQALDPEQPPQHDVPAPRATAVIAAYLPNEAETIVETVQAFLAQQYAGGLQIVLAYNTPFALPVEDELARLAAGHPDLTVLKVPDSTSKAQNVNAALRVAEGEFVGIFDADHHPMPGAFDRAWAWLGDDSDPTGPVDVVQGHCVIRNGEDSALAKLVAVEFEQIYAVSHPGRAQLHGFGIFGGSNGYWRASALERIRLRGSFLTEDIEASMRVLAAGGRIVNDPGLISRELAPETARSLWKQRMRWAQGWFQVSLRHLGPILVSGRLSVRQKIGATYLLGWREVYPWMATLSWPLIAFFAWRDGGIDLASPIFALITLVVTVSGPLQTFAAWRLATPEIRRHKRWFVGAAIANALVYTEVKNVVARVAHLKQLRGEHQWVVTPRTSPGAGGTTRHGATPELEEVAA